ncbi:MAG: chemotaxis protein CheW [Deltaproteobacteria bacterium]|nr:chemotaxis protein CheW [Deltaproteobacteria bacterium]
MDTSKYKALYLQETNEHLSGIEKGLLAIEKGSVQSTDLDSLFRHYHSIKGMSASMGYDSIMKLSHAQEDLLSLLRSNKLALTIEIAAALLYCLDALKNLVKRVEEDLPLDVDISTFVNRLKSAIEGRPPEIRAEPAPITELKLSNVMKVEGKVFDDLLAIVGDLFMTLSSFKSLSHNSRSIEFKDSVYLLGKSLNGIHHNILSARMLPIEDLTENLPRVVRDISKQSGKNVELKIEGADLSLDRAILESLGSPMVHIIRNAVDHGIEPLSDRIHAGKSPEGNITVRAFAKKDKVIVEVADDGKGIDCARVREKAIKGGLPEGRVRAMSDREAMMLVCLPGLSTSDSVTDTSGRGVGMDVVKDTIEGIGGTLEIDSVPGKGTKITLDLPRTTSIIKTLLIWVEGEPFLIPLSKIERVAEVGREDISGGVLGHNGAEVPVVPLAGLLGIEEGTVRPLYTIIIVENGKGAQGNDGLIGLRVDDFGDEMEAYIKPLVPPMSRLWGVTGIAVMGDGRPVFLLDLPQIISRAASQAF